MTTTQDDRIEALEQRVAGWETRLRELELGRGRVAAAAPPAFGDVVPGPAPGSPPMPRAVAAPPASRSFRPPVAPRPAAVRAKRADDAPAAPAPGVSLEQLLGGRALAWAGGAAVLAGLAFLFALGVSTGWLDETRRCVLGTLLAAGCVAGGVQLQQRHGRTTAGLAAIGAGIAGLFLAIGFATSDYDVLPAVVGTVLAGAVGALGVRLALRWDAAAIAGVGLLGAALAPTVSGALEAPGGLLLLWVAAAAGTTVVVQRRWAWLGVALAAVVTPQWLLAVAPGDLGDGLPFALACLVGFGVLGVAAAIGHELRVPAAGLRPSSTLLLAGMTFVLALPGYVLVDDAAGAGVATGWLGVLAAALLSGGIVLRRSDRLSDELTLLVLALGTGVADIAFALAFGGVPRAAGWVASMVGFAWLTRRAHGSLDPQLATAGLGLHVALAAVASGAEVEASVSAAGTIGVAAGTLLAGLAAGLVTAARLLTGARRDALDALGLLALAGLAVLSLDGLALVGAWAAEAAALAAIARRAGALGAPVDGAAHRAGALGAPVDDAARRAESPWVPAVGALAHLALALAWCLAGAASPAGLAEPAADLGGAAAGVLLLAAAGGRVAWAWRGTPGRETAGAEPSPAGVGPGASCLAALVPPLVGATALVGLYLASLVAVAVRPVGADAMQGQLQLTALWAAAGALALVVGLRRDLAPVRRAALALLGVAVGKLVAVDLTTLAAAWRVAACLLVGLLLLAAAFAHARLRPEPLPDLREKETAFR